MRIQTMKIELTISTHTLGDCNTADDNQRYAIAVQTELQSEYPDADISVELVTNVTARSCWVSNDPTGEVEENVNLIANQVWDKADYGVGAAK
nr:hypothetical protein [Ralstonia sp.]